MCVYLKVVMLWLCLCDPLWWHVVWLLHLFLRGGRAPRLLTLKTCLPAAAAFEMTARHVPHTIPRTWHFSPGISGVRKKVRVPSFGAGDGLSAWRILSSSLSMLTDMLVVVLGQVFLHTARPSAAAGWFSAHGNVPLLSLIGLRSSKTQLTRLPARLRPVWYLLMIFHHLDLLLLLYRVSLSLCAVTLCVVSVLILAVCCRLSFSPHPFGSCRCAEPRSETGSTQATVSPLYPQHLFPWSWDVLFLTAQTCMSSLQIVLEGIPHIFSCVLQGAGWSSSAGAITWAPISSEIFLTSCSREGVLLLWTSRNSLGQEGPASCCWGPAVPQRGFCSTLFFFWHKISLGVAWTPLLLSKLIGSEAVRISGFCRAALISCFCAPRPGKKWHPRNFVSLVTCF